MLQRSTSNNSVSKSNTKKLDPDKPITWLNELIIPYDIAINPNISKITQNIYGVIKSLDGPNGCYASNEYFAKILQCCTDSVIKSINKLKEHNYIEYELTENKFRTIRINHTKINELRDNRIRKLEQYEKKRVERSLPHKYSIDNNKLLSYAGTSSCEENLESEKQPKKEIKVPKCPIDILSLWNKQKQVPSHRQGTKLHAKINLYINQLLDGTFGSRNSISPNFIHSQDFPIDYHHRQFTMREITTGIENMAKMFQEGMAPKDKTWLKKMDLADLIYNPRSRKSQLLKCMYYEVEPLNEQFDFAIQDVSKYWLKELKPLIDEESLAPEHRITLRNNLLYLDKYYDWMWAYPLKIDQRLKRHLPDEHVFFDWYEKWLSKRSVVRAYHIGPKSKDFPLFLKWLTEECLGIDTSIDDRDYEVKYLDI